MARPSKLGACLQVWRAFHHQDQKALAHEIGISESTLCRLEKGQGGLSAESLLKVMVWLVGQPDKTPEDM